MRYGGDDVPAFPAARRPRRAPLLPLLALALLATGAPCPTGLGGAAALAKEPNQRPFLAPEYQVMFNPVRDVRGGRPSERSG